MAVKNPQFEINIRKNTNANNPGYGKYYPKAVEKQTISLRGLCNHMAEHNSIYGRDIIQGVRWGQDYVRGLQGYVFAGDLRCGGEGRPHARGDWSQQEAVHQEGDAAGGLDRGAEGTEPLITCGGGLPLEHCGGDCGGASR